MATEKIDTSDIIAEVIPTHPTDFLRVVNRNMVLMLSSKDEASLTIPTLMERAKTFVNKDRYITLLYKKEPTNG